MDQQYLQPQSNYDPNKLFNTIINRLHLRNDAALCQTLRVNPPLISKIRHRKSPLAASVLIRLHEESGLSIRELRNMLGDRRQKYRVGDASSKRSS